MKLIKKAFLLILVVFLGAVIWYWDGTPPTAKWEGPTDLGRESQLELQVGDAGRGLRSIEVWLTQGEQTVQIYSREFSSAPHPR